MGFLFDTINLYGGINMDETNWKEICYKNVKSSIEYKKRELNRLEEINELLLNGRKIASGNELILRESLIDSLCKAFKGELSAAQFSAALNMAHQKDPLSIHPDLSDIKEQIHTQTLEAQKYWNSDRDKAISILKELQKSLYEDDKEIKDAIN